MWITALLLAVLLLVILHRVYVGLYASSPNPFAEDVKRPPEPLVTDKEARKKVLKQGQLMGFRPALGPSAHVSPLVKCWENFSCTQRFHNLVFFASERVQALPLARQIPAPPVGIFSAHGLHRIRDLSPTWVWSQLFPILLCMLGGTGKQH